MPNITFSKFQFVQVTKDVFLNNTPLKECIFDSQRYPVNPYLSQNEDIIVVFLSVLNSDNFSLFLLLNNCESHL